jgi:hypothetical protein
LNGQKLNIFVGTGVMLALGGGASLRSGAARGHVRGRIAQGAFFFCFFSFGRAKEKKKAFRDEHYAVTPLVGQQIKRGQKTKVLTVLSVIELFYHDNQIVDTKYSLVCPLSV